MKSKFDTTKSPKKVHAYNHLIFQVISKKFGSDNVVKSARREIIVTLCPAHQIRTVLLQQDMLTKLYSLAQKSCPPGYILGPTFHKIIKLFIYERAYKKSMNRTFGSDCTCRYLLHWKCTIIFFISDKCIQDTVLTLIRQICVLSLQVNRYL